MPTTHFDLHASNQGLFTHFYPMTAAGETAWREIAAQCENGIVPTVHAASTIAQIKAAGYRVTSRTVRLSKSAAADDALMAALGL